MITIREFADSDYEFYCEIHNAIYTEYPTTVRRVRRSDETFDLTKYLRKRYGAAEDKTSRVVAVAEFSHEESTFDPQKFWLDIMVHPRWQRKGIGSLLYNKCLDEVAKIGAIVLWASAREDFYSAINFLTERGFTEKRRRWESRLDLSKFDPKRFSKYIERARNDDITIRTLVREKVSNPNWQRELYQLDIEAEADEPMVDQYTAISFEEYARKVLEDPQLIPEAWFIAKHRELYVGCSRLWPAESQPKLLTQGFTCVKREYRGRGVAVALKLNVINCAKERGYNVIRTWNDSENMAMLAVNQKLGFGRYIGWITFEKRMEDSER